MKISIELLHDGKPMLRRPIDHDPVVVGRNPECDICVPNDEVAPVQFVARREGEALKLVNKHSDGTAVNKEIVRETMQLANGDEISLGEVSARVSFEEGEEHENGGRTRTLAAAAPPGSAGFVLTLPERFPGGHPIPIFFFC